MSPDRPRRSEQIAIANVMQPAKLFREQTGTL